MGNQRKTFLPSLLWIAGLMPLSALNLDGNGMCDVWQARYHAGALVAAHDEDGDGRNNGDEARAGTDPFDPTSVFKAGVVSSGSAVTLTFATQPGKRYRLAYSSALNGTWTPIGEPQLCLTSELQLIGPVGGKRRFYRVEVSDADSDADGVTDWAEMQLGGYDRENANTFAATSGDLTGVKEWLAALAGGELAATVVSATAMEKEGEPAEISYVRAGSQTRPFTVFLKTKGPTNSSRSAAGPGDWRFTDSNGVSVTDRLVIPSGESAVALRVLPVADALAEVPEHLHVLVGGSSLDTGLTITDAADTEANQRLFVAYLRPLPGPSSLGSGIATVRLPGDNDTATVTVSFSNLNSPVNSTQVQTENSAIIKSVPPFNYGGQSWEIRASQFYLTDQAMLEALFAGQIHLGIYTEKNVTGEIGGTFQITPGTTEFQEPPAPLPITPITGAALDRDIVRFLTQSTFGPTPQDVQALRDLVASHGGDRIAAFSAWIDAEFSTASPSLEAYTRAANDQELALYSDPSKPYYNPNRLINQTNRRCGWWLFARHAPDALRQRVAFALSEIFVISDDNTAIQVRAYGTAHYYDMLKTGAFGSYRQLLEGVSLHPIMGHYLSHLKNQKAILDINGIPITSPDENYAREIMQLFSIGLVQLHPDGLLKLGANGLPIATYSQDGIAEMSRVFTGLAFSKRNNPSASDTVVDNTSFFASGGIRYYEASWTHPMKMFATYHDTGAKSVLGLEIAAGQTGEQDLAAAFNHLAAHPNTAPFICRRLIQRLVTANPSRGYLYRVSSAFTSSNGNLGSVIRAILLDPEARSLQLADASAGAGKVREPLLRYTAFLRAFDAKSQLLLSDLSAYGYPASELAKFPEGITLMRVGSTDASLGQTPQSAPSVFNWFLPDYAPAGKLSANGLLSPELQIANENSTFTSTNYIYTLIYSGTGLNGVPLVNQLEAPTPYTSSSDNLIIPYATKLEALYLGVVDTNGDGSFTNLDTTTFNNTTAITSACEAVLDYVDLMLCGGALKARYGDTPGKPRAIILSGAASVRSEANSNNATQASVMRDRIEDILWLVSSSPEFVVQK
ncbi:MAG: DUF1800 family protein [Akkermansiaceae bacterium]